MALAGACHDKVDVGECARYAHTCDPNATCTDGPSGFTCACNAGYAGDGTTCAAIDPCLAGTHHCDPLTTCTSASGSYSCGACPEGYAGTGDTRCVDINECDADNGGCAQTCENTTGSFHCACIAGYAINADGHSCDALGCLGPDGAVIAHATGGIYYETASVPDGEMCVSETRACLLGTLSGSFQYPSCTAPFGLLRPESVSASLGQDELISATPLIVASVVLHLDRDRAVLLHGAGNWFRAEGTAVGQVSLRVDGAAVGTEASMLFHDIPCRHPFAVDAGLNLAAGGHQVDLVARRSVGSGSFWVQATTQLSVLVGFEQVQQVLLAQSPEIDSNIDVQVLSLSVLAPALVEHMGTIVRTYGAGDAITRINVDGSWHSTLGINDLIVDHDEVVPISTQALVPAWGGPSWHTVDLVASRLWVPPDYTPDVRFQIWERSGLLAAWGNITDSVVSVAGPDVFVGNESVVVAQVAFELPPGHNGRAWLTAQGRWLDLVSTDGGGMESACLELDGEMVGPFAVQYFENAMTQSQRTFALGYLATGLAPGVHTAQVRCNKAPPDANQNLTQFVSNTQLVVLW